LLGEVQLIGGTPATASHIECTSPDASVERITMYSLFRDHLLGTGRDKTGFRPISFSLFTHGNGFDRDA
jgi:hypothetical protein